MKDHLNAVDSERSSNIDGTDRTASISDESVAKEILVLETNEAVNASSVWGDIYRNKYIKFVSDPPEQLTPEYGRDVHAAIKFDALRNSVLRSSITNNYKTNGTGKKLSVQGV